MHYLPEAEASLVSNVVVDGSPNDGTVLTISHWPRTPTPPSLAADTSAEMVLRYVEQGAALHGDVGVATNNHYDQDGTAGLFALIEPEAALARRALVVDLARAGDFAVYADRTAARASMALATLGANVAPGPYAEQCAALYVEALGILAELLDHPDRFRRLWEDEDAVLATSEAAVADGRVEVRELADIDLAVVTVADEVPGTGGHRFGSVHQDGLHPMALHAVTDCSRLLVFHGPRMRYADRYEGWVQYRSRVIPRRTDLAPLAELLTAADDGVTWTASKPSVITPILEPEDDSLSSLSRPAVETAVVEHLRTAPPAFDPFPAQEEP